MPSEIMVHLDGHESSFVRAKAALGIASSQSASVRGLVVGATPSSSFVANEEVSEATLRTIERNIAERAEAVKRRAEKELGIEVTLLSTSDDRVQVECASVMRAADFTAIAPPEYNDTTLDDDVFEAALFLSGRPALVISRKAELRGIGRNVLIAWKDCREAARAVHDAVPFLKSATSVRLLAVTGEDDARFFGQKALDRMAAHLAAIGAPVHQKVIAAGVGGAAAAILDEARDCDLIVMGGYGHWRLSEWLFGGVTKSLLRHSAIPLFMSR